MSRFLVLLILVLLSGGCSKDDPCPDMRFERFLKVNRIVITDNHNNELRTIQDDATISGITNFAVAHGSDWKAPWHGTPVALVRANFYIDDKFLGDFGVGNNFLTAQGCRAFLSRQVSQNERSEIMQLFAVLDPYAKNQ